MLSVLTAVAGSAPTEAAIIDPRQMLLAGIIYGLLILVGLVVDVLLLILLINRPPRIGLRFGRLMRRPVHLRDAALLLAVLACLLALAGLVAGMVPMTEGAMLAMQSLLLHWLLLALLATTLKVRRLSAYRAFGLRPGRLGNDLVLGILLYLAMVPAFVVCAALYGLALQALGYEPTLQPVAEILTSEPRLWLRVYLLFMAAVLAPAAEELVFRGVALPVLARRLGVAPAIFLVSAVFAAIHFHVEAVVPLFLASVCFSTAYAVTGRIAVPMAMHGLFNAVNLLVLLGGAT